MITEEQRTAKLQALPEHLQDIYVSPELGTTMLSVHTKYLPETSNYSTYAQIIGDAILGIHQTTTISKKLQMVLDVSADDAQRIMSDLSDFLTPVAEWENTQSERNREGLQALEHNFKALREEAIAGSAPETPPIPAPAPAAPVPEPAPTPAPEPVAAAPAPENLPTANPDGLANPIAVQAMAEIGEHVPAPEPVIPDTPTPSDPGVEAAVAAAQTDPAKVAQASMKASYTVEPMHTMQSDITRIHGYGAYRDLYPDEQGEQAQKEETIKAATQEELLGQKPQLADNPDYRPE